MSRGILTKGYRTHGGRKKSVLDFFDIFAFLIFIGGIAGIIRFFIFMPYTVEGSSMSDTFHDKDFIIVDKITPKYGELKRGDVIVFVPPGKDIPFIKRIVGLPGETIKLFGGKVFICSSSDQDIKECNRLQEGYLSDGVTTEARCGLSTFTVENGYLVFGDNRGYSTDSRCCFGLGCLSGTNYTLPQNRIIGKVFGRLFPTPSSFANEGYWYENK